MVENTLYAKLPQYLLGLRSRGNQLAWTFDLIPAVIEAGRAAGLVNRGGDLQILLPGGGRGESYNFGVWIHDVRLSPLPPDCHVDVSAALALYDFRSLGGQVALMAEAMAGWGRHFLADAPKAEEVLCFEWRFTEPRGGL